MKLFIDYMNIKVNENEVITAMLLCNCKKIDNVQQKGKLETYAKEGAEYLQTLGFNKRFCKICEEVNRFNAHETREKEGDLLEVVDQFTGLILRRVERDAFTPLEAIMILKERNLKNVKNIYLNDFIKFVEKLEHIYIKEVIDVPILKKLVSIHNREANVRTFIAALGNKYTQMIQKALSIPLDKNTKQIIDIKQQELRKSVQLKGKALFSEEVAERIMKHEEKIKTEE